jgi:hypothetical protein
MTRIVLTVFVLLDCVAFGTELFAQAGQTINPVPLTADLEHGNHHMSDQLRHAGNVLPECVRSGEPPANPAAPATSGACNLNCTTQQLICKQRC